MCAQHHRRARRNVSDVVDEDHTKRAEMLDNEAIMDDFVVTEDGRLKDPSHPVERFNGLFDAGAKSPRCREYDVFNLHGKQPSDERFSIVLWVPYHDFSLQGRSFYHH